jgi:hypothetical protein
VWTRASGRESGPVDYCRVYHDLVGYSSKAGARGRSVSLKRGGKTLYVFNLRALISPTTTSVFTFQNKQ